MRAIPVRLLIHEAELYDVERSDYGDEQECLSARLRRVRLEPSVRLVTDTRGVDVQCVATLYIDAHSSLPTGVEPKIGQVVVWRGKRYRVVCVSAYDDMRGPHHWEAELADG